MCIVEDKIVLAAGRSLFELNLNKLFNSNDDKDAIFKDWRREFESEEGSQEILSFEMRDCRHVKLEGSFIFHQFVNIGDDRSAMILE